MRSDSSQASETNHVVGEANMRRVVNRLPPAGLWRVIPDVSLRTRTGLASLGAAALIGATVSLAAIAIAGARDDGRSLPAYVSSLCSAAFGAASRQEAPFLAENQGAMLTMMAGMAIKPSGNVDRDFVAIMVAHHQGATDMAQALLRYGRNEQLRRIAQEIIVEQGQEITAMRFALGQPLPPSLPAPDQLAPVNHGNAPLGSVATANESAS